MSEKPSKYYVTTPIYYVNDKPHIGHSYTTILADVLANYHRLLDVPTHFLTGTDEHGQKVQQAADANGITPQEQCDQTVVRFQELWKRLEIKNDDFIRTTEPRHKKVVQETLQELFDRDEIYKAEYEGWYCVGCERFFTEKDLVEGNCPECGRPVDKIIESNYFFRMSKYQDWLIDYIESNPGFIQPAFRANETLGFLKNKELQDLCISRPKARLAWGIELPFDADFVTYVWFDALINYISAVGYKSDEEQFKKWWPCSTHLIGKDILTTHTVYWPTMLKAMNVAMPESIFAHGWWLTGRTKMSKSLGNVVNPMDMIDNYGVDAFRYFLIAEMTLGQDASFTEEAFVKRYNADLANDLGNVTNRVLNMISRYCGDKMPAPAKDAGFDTALDDALWKDTVAVAEEMGPMISNMKLDASVGLVMSAVRKINVYLQERAPWSLAKQEGSEAEVAHCLYTAAECLRVCAALLYPVMPAKMLELRTALGMADAKPHLGKLAEFGVLIPGSEISQPGALFPRIEAKKVDGASSSVAKEQKPAKKNQKSEIKNQKSADGLITFDQVMNVKLKTAVVLEAEKIEGADKLLKLQIDLGEEKRQLVAGIALHYAPEDLVGKTIVVVANLKPAKLRGVKSEGMLLCASIGDNLKLVTVEGDLGPGAAVK
ncbi:methionine--tRNA ligase [Pontiella sulfatireligans]|uniref:Methionine--tRNA ligase n=1 Tax=Pontiella sulfatireligans TaxID=2750658 RepID=A0A6C2UQC0_9BACT|nr:methionine--tRNA ligase [Pontiella sulfatireligans]VGO22485.1 Methionine--tRNA ligase [Pontiella sulfatireligans]